MITGLDHVVLLCPDIEAGVDTYSALFGTSPVWRAEGEGAAQAVFRAGDTALELMAPRGEGAVAGKLKQMASGGARLTSLVFRSDALSHDHRQMDHRGLEPGDISRGESRDLTSGAVRSWQRYRIPDARMAGIKTFILQPEAGDLPPTKPGPADVPGRVSGLDHLVIETPNPDRTVANYGGRLDLHFAVDRTFEQWGTRFLFFRADTHLPGPTLEVIHRIGKSGDPQGPDHLGGLSWASDDLGAAHKRLQAAGLRLSDIRSGRQPGTDVFTVHDGTLGVPTLFIQSALV